MEQPWTAVASFVVSLLALGVAGLSLWISWRRDERDRAAVQPTARMTIKLYAADPDPDWYEVELTVWNRSKEHLRLKEIVIVSPWRARALRQWDVLYQTPSGGFEMPGRLPLEKSWRRITVDIDIPPAGTLPRRSAAHVEHGDHYSQTLFVRARRSRWSSKLAIRAVLSWDSPIERRSEIDIVRQLPQASRTANA